MYHCKIICTSATAIGLIVPGKSLISTSHATYYWLGAFPNFHTQNHIIHVLFQCSPQNLFQSMLPENRAL